MDVGSVVFVAVVFFSRGREEYKEDKSIQQQQLSSHLLSNLNPPPPPKQQPAASWKAFSLFTYENTWPASYHSCQAWNVKRVACDHLQVFLFLILQLQSFSPVLPSPHPHTPPFICLKIPVLRYVHFKLICAERFRANVVCRWGCNTHWQSQMVGDCGQTWHLDNVQSLAGGHSAA